MTVRETLSQCYITAELSESVLAELSAIAQVTDHETEAELIKVGDRTQDLVILAKGAMEIRDMSGQMSKHLLPVTVLGEVAFLDSQPRTASVFVMPNSRVVRLPAKELQSYLREKPEVAAEVYRRLGITVCRRLRRTNEQVESLSARDE